MAQQHLTHSRSNFGGRAVVALLEAMPSELSALLHAHDAIPITVPVVPHELYLELEEVRNLLDELAAGQYEVVVFMSGGAVSALFACAHELGRRSDLVSALRGLTITCRGPKATAGLRRFGLSAKPEASAPLTTTRLLRSLQPLDLAGKGVLRFNGEPDDVLAQSLLTKGANLREISLLQRRSAKDTAESEALVRMVVTGAVHALVVSCEIQFLHLYQVARKLQLAREFIYALRKRVVVAALGAPSRATVEEHGLRPHLMPAQPQMLIMALMHFLETRASAALAVASPSPLSS